MLGKAFIVLKSCFNTDSCFAQLKFIVLGGSGLTKSSLLKTEAPGSMNTPHTAVDSDGSDR